MSPTRNLTYPGNVLLIDGISGSGKTMITRLADAYTTTTSPAFNYSLEYTSILHSLEKLDTSTAQVLLKLNMDQRRYDGSISREVNLRPSDLSSVLKSSKRNEYLLSLLKNDSPDTSAEKMRLHPNLCFVTHQLNGATKLIEDTFLDKYFELLCVRHPYYLLSHWESYVPLLGNSPRDFTLWVDFRGNNVPWFIQRNMNLYLNSDPVNRAALCVVEILQQTFQKLTVNDSRRVVIPFERFVLQPRQIVAEIEEKLPVGKSSSMSNILKKEKVPRQHINSGRNLPIYRRYGSGALNSISDMRNDFKEKELAAQERLSPEIFNDLRQLSDRYFTEFGEWF